MNEEKTREIYFAWTDFFFVNSVKYLETFLLVNSVKYLRLENYMKTANRKGYNQGNQNIY
jgi:hypothetical protein